jgi:hypothetical protein
MTTFTKKVFTSTLLIITTFSIVFSQSNFLRNFQVVEASELSFTIDVSSFPNLSTSTFSTSETRGTVSVAGVSIDVGIKNAKQTTSGSKTYLDMTKNASVIYNINPLPGTIKSIEIVQKTGQGTTLNLGATSRIINDQPGVYSPTEGTSLGSTTANSTNQTFTSSNLAIIGQRDDLTYFSLFSTGDVNIEYITFIMTVAAIVATSGQTYSFAVDFLEQTESKKDLCTDVDLKWSFSSVSPIETASTVDPTTLEVKYSKLTESQQTAFKTDTTDPQILLARQRYLYLITKNPYNASTTPATGLYDFIYNPTRTFA